MAKSRKATGLVKRHHAFNVLIMICGWIVPPLAILVRFGVGCDFFTNIVLTICGYFPGQIHNFWAQNIRNNKNGKHSPAWAVRNGLVKDYRIKKTANGWSDRYGDAAKQFESQDVIVDPISGETRGDADYEQRQRGNVRSRSFFPSPWANNYDDSINGSQLAERQLPHENERGPIRDPVTGAIIDGGSGDPARFNSRNGGGAANSSSDSLSRTGSRRSLGSQYAERYAVNKNGNNNNNNNSSSSSKNNSNNDSTYRADAPPTSSSSSKATGWLSGIGKKKKKDRWAREADVMGPSSPHSFGSESHSFEDAAIANGSAPRHHPSSGTIRDPMQDRHDF